MSEPDVDEVILFPYCSPAGRTRFEKNIQMEHLDERAKGEIHERILNEIPEDGPVTFRELKDGLGVDRELLAGMLRGMKEVGQIDYDERRAGFLFKNAIDVEIEWVGGAGSV